MIEQILHSLSLFLPETTLTVFFCAAIIVGLVAGRTSRASLYVALIGIALATWFAIQQAGSSEGIFTGMVVVDPFATFFKLLIGMSAIVILLFSLYSAEVQSTAHRHIEYGSLLLAMTLGMFLMAGSTNLLMMVLAIELTSLSSYVLAGYTREATDSSEASLKYIIYGAVSTGLMLYGVSILFGLTGATDFYNINRALATGSVNATALLVATIMIVA